MKMIYLDNHATTPVDPRVVDAMNPYHLSEFGNSASSSHRFGWKAKAAVGRARQTVAKHLGGVDLESVIFTSGATESNNLVIKGLVLSRLSSGKPLHLITTKIEHKCVLESCEFVAKQFGVEVTYLDVDEHGLVNPDDVQAALKPHTFLVSVHAAHNEIGTIQPIAELVRVVHENSEALFHTDAAQALGKLPLDVLKSGVDFLSFSAHKFYGPKGVGGLYVAQRSPKISFVPLLHGGGQEFGLRSGTLNVAGVVGMACALDLCVEELGQESHRLTQLRDGMATRLQDELDCLVIHGHPTRRLPHNLNVSFRFVDTGLLMTRVPHVALSSGSACSSGSVQSSYVIRALGQPDDVAGASIRFGLGRFTTQNGVDQALSDIIAAAKALRDQSLEYEMYLSSG